MVKNKKGFTLVELLAVIVILAIILVIAVPQIMKTIDEARKGALSSSAKLIAASAEREYLARKTIGDTDFDPEDVEMECSEVADTTADYTNCSITFNNGKATVQLEGAGKFAGKYVCAGTREAAVVTTTACSGGSGGESTTQVTLTVDTNGGTVTTTQSGNYTAGSTVELTVPTAQEGKEFDYWQVTVGADKGASVTGNTLTMGTEATTVKAIWKDVQASVTPVSFTTDSWATIASAVSDGTYPTEYTVGLTKEINLDINGDGTDETYHLRVANTTPCDGSLSSQTACGFVLEFVEVIATYNMNPAGEYNGTQYDNGTNLGGWPASAMRTYLSETILPMIQEEIGNIIIDTYVVSGTGSDGTTGNVVNANAGVLSDGNYWSKDKLYLLSTREVWGKEETSNPISNDKADGEDVTRQLDYYKGKGVTTAIKQNASGTDTIWWLRSANSGNRYRFFGVYTGGGWCSSNANNTNGVSPAFRIG